MDRRTDMRLDDLAELMRQLEAGLVALGVSRDAARAVVKDAECASVADMLETQQDRRFLDLFDQMGSGPLAQRKGVSARTICRQRADAVERLCRKQIGHSVSSTLSEEAA